jgi:hypothetical protein
MQALGLDPLGDLFDPPAAPKAKRASSPGGPDDGLEELAEGDLELVELVELPTPDGQKA